MSVHELLRANDERFRALAQGFSAEDWSCPSLCERWSNHEVLAHLVVGLSASLHSVVGAMLGHRGSFDSANAEMARTLAAVRSPADLLDDYERLSREPRGLGRYFPSRLLLGDHVTHELDMVFALDREPEIPAACPDRGAEHPSGRAESLRTRVPEQQGPAAAGDRRRVEPRRAGTAGRRPRSRTRLGARQPAEGAATPRRRRRRRARVAAQPPDPYGRVRISM